MFLTKYTETREPTPYTAYTEEQLTKDERVYVAHHALAAGKKALRLLDAKDRRIAELESAVRLQLDASAWRATADGEKGHRIAAESRLAEATVLLREAGPQSTFPENRSRWWARRDTFLTTPVALPAPGHTDLMVPPETLGPDPIAPTDHERAVLEACASLTIRQYRDGTFFAPEYSEICRVMVSELALRESKKGNSNV